MSAFRSTGPARSRAAWLAWMLFAVALAGCKNDVTEVMGDKGCQPLDPVPTRIWRLSVQQYSNSIRDLLGLPAAPDLGTMGGQSTYAFFADETLTVDPQLAFNVNTTVRQILDGMDASQLAACMPGEGQDVCAQRFAQ